MRRWWPAGIAFAVGLLPRLGLPWMGGGPRGTFGYDSGVYYAAADALVHGRLPYADYTLLHPPAIVLALAPFAQLGSFAGDHAGFMAAVTAFAILGAANAALVTRLVEDLGWGRRAALAGGVAYATWFGSVGAEYLIRLEPLGNLFTLLGLRALVAAERRPGRRWSVLAGAGLGAAAVTKIWWAVPALVVLVWHLAAAPRRRRLAAYAGGVAAGVGVIAGPFFVAAPGAMWHMVVLDQLHRAPMPGGLLSRLARLTGVAQLLPAPSPSVLETIVALGAAAFAVAVVAAWRAPFGLLAVALAVTQLAVLVRAPSYFTAYDDYLAVPLALLLAAAVRRRAAPAPVPVARRRWGLALAVTVAAALAVVDVVAPGPPVKPFPAAALRAQVAGARCVMSDEPMALIELDVLSVDFTHHCPNWVDVTGRTYGPDRDWSVPRARNRRWQADLTRYLFAGQRIVLERPGGTGIGPALWHRLRAAGLLHRSRIALLYRGSRG